MNSIKGPAIFLAQFVREKSPFHTLPEIAAWAKNLGYAGIQVPAWEDPRFIDLRKAAESKSYCEDWRGRLDSIGIKPTELNASLAGQVMAIHPAYETAFQAFYPKGLNDQARVEWASDQLRNTLLASANLGLDTVPTLSGGLAWHLAYPWPQSPDGLVEEAMDVLASRWYPLLDIASEYGQSIAYELHPGSDLFDGHTWEMFLDAVGEHPAAAINYDPSHFLLQQMDYIEFIRLYCDRIRGFHVKDAEFRPNGKGGVYGGYQPWAGRAGRFRSLGDGNIDFKQIFSLLTEVGYRGWAVLEWECCIKSPEQGACEGAPYIKEQIIEPTEIAFDSFAGGKTDRPLNRKILGLDEDG